MFKNHWYKPSDEDPLSPRSPVMKFEEENVIDENTYKPNSGIQIINEHDEYEQEKLDKIKGKEIRYRNRIMNELRIMKNLDHPNIVKMYEYFEDDKNIYALFEKWGNNLFEEIILSRDLSLPRCSMIFKQLLSVVKYLESNEMCHLNLKPENILIDNDMSIKVWGFGSALNLNWVKKKKDLIFPIIDKSIIEPYWIAPEILEIKPRKLGNNDESFEILEEI